MKREAKGIGTYRRGKVLVYPYCKKNVKACALWNAKGRARLSCDGEIMGRAQILSASQQKSGITRMELYQQKHCWSDSERQTSWILQGGPTGLLGCEVLCSSSEGRRAPKLGRHQACSSPRAAGHKAVPTLSSLAVSHPKDPQGWHRHLRGLEAGYQTKRIFSSRI